MSLFARDAEADRQKQAECFRHRLRLSKGDQSRIDRAWKALKTAEKLLEEIGDRNLFGNVSLDATGALRHVEDAVQQMEWHVPPTTVVAQRHATVGRQRFGKGSDGGSGF